LKTILQLFVFVINAKWQYCNRFTVLLVHMLDILDSVPEWLVKS